MRNNIVQLHEIDEYKDFLGNKTFNLKKCTDWGFNVPKFIALPSYVSRNLLTNEILRKEVVKNTIDILQADRYVVRSSALIEDGEDQSFAGQFLTEINLLGDELDCGIYKVLKQAEVFLKGDLEKFSIIIQEYIASDISGVTFTRNPNGNREMVIEYGFCEGEKIVSGKIKPNVASFYWDSRYTINLPKTFFVNQAIENFKELERKNNFPQDIEWCIKANQFYVLQTRPITTISLGQYEQMLFLDSLLFASEKYYFEKTDISEIAPRPSIITFDLLKLIYSENGPVDNVYKKYGIKYRNTEFLRIIGNELFVDKEREIQGLLPSYSYLHNKDFVAKFHFLSKTIVTIKNFFFLNKIQTKYYDKLFEMLKTRIESEKEYDLDGALDNFLCDYKLIFETNLLSGLSIKKANLLLRNESVSFTEILNGCLYFVDLTKYRIYPPKGLRGNSLELADESDFVANENIRNKSNGRVMEWWQKVPEYRRKMMLGVISEAIVYNRLRELGRWLAVKNINNLRFLLLSCAENNGFQTTKNVYFAKLEDILNGKIEEPICIMNKDLYDRYNDFNLPNSIMSELMFNKSNILGISSGIASGTLQSREFIGTENNRNEKYILYTEILSPDLTKYFDRISGIVSNNGGLLSHLAIMAREKNIPVISGFSISDSEFKLGDYVQIDGDSGKIEKVELYSETSLN